MQENTQEQVVGQSGKNKKIYFIVGAAALLILIAIAVWFWLIKPATEPPQEILPAQEPTQESTYGTLPETKSLTNPLEKLPELNPVDRTNPFKDVYKNPFE